MKLVILLYLIVFDEINQGINVNRKIINHEVENAENSEYKFKKALVSVLSIRKKARKKKAKQIETSWGTKNLLPTVMRSFCAMLLPLLTKDPSKSMNFDTCHSSKVAKILFKYFFF